jgi:hypothetical protein
MAIPGFKKASVKPAAKPPARRASRYAGVKAAKPRDPLLDPGDWILRITSAEVTRESGAAWFRATFEVVATDYEGATEGEARAYIQAIDGKSERVGLPKVKAFLIAASGHADEDAYDEWDPDAELLEAVLDGVQNSKSDDAAALLGADVACTCRRGKERDDGDFYREHAWAAVESE